MFWRNMRWQRGRYLMRSKDLDDLINEFNEATGLLKDL